ncbi:hypothetical protein [Streptomyces sp. NPDC058398]|uniref:hypothetical protein n=1 Tax=Streptomyces sp. NPDC058398 TaxID=3346479 RepID=UPI0036612580
MRIRTWLKRRYTRPQAVALFLPSVALSTATTFTLSRLGLPRAGVTAISFIFLFAVFGIAASVIDRRTRG